MSDKLRYLKVDFGDNDFGSFVQEAVERLSGDIHKSNAHNLVKDPNNKHFSSRTISDIFASLRRAGALQLLLERAVDAACHYDDVEAATRGLYWKKVDWNEKKVTKEFVSVTDKSISLNLSFHRKRSDKWANGEAVWLDMETGEVVSR